MFFLMYFVQENELKGSSLHAQEMNFMHSSVESGSFRQWHNNTLECKFCSCFSAIRNWGISYLKALKRQLNINVLGITF